jgi:hypothetical protein
MSSMVSLLWLTVFASVLSAQTDPRAAQAATLLKPASLQVPKGEGAWAVRVMQGGVSAGQSSDVAVTSVGELTCLPESEGRCSKVNSGEVLQSVTALMDPKLLRNSKSALGDSCRDCPITSITISRRDEKGKIDTYFAYWDDVTAAKAPFQLVRIATTLLASVKK